MCCFSGPVNEVHGTRIFARGTGDRQILVYSMSVAFRQEVAMILPLPVPLRPTEDAVRFIDLSDYPTFFADMGRGFVGPPAASDAATSLSAEATSPLRVH